MRAWLRRCLLVLAVCALCWGGAIWYWRAGTRVPTAGDRACGRSATMASPGGWIGPGPAPGAPSQDMP